MADDPMHDEHGPRDDPSPMPTIIIGTVAVVLLLVIVIWLQAIFNDELQAERALKEVNMRYTDLDDFNARQMRRLDAYGWIDPEAEIVHIPIERAMELTVRELAARR